MKHGEKISPIAAAISAAATLLCCVPLGFATAAASASLGAVAVAYRPWFLGAALVLLAIGAVQVTRAQRVCRTRQTGSILVLSLSATTVLLVMFFPQVVATLIADLLP
jgi:hypothetical protein